MAEKMAAIVALVKAFGEQSIAWVYPAVNAAVNDYDGSLLTDEFRAIAQACGLLSLYEARSAAMPKPAEPAKEVK